jgi:hypothetical protein
VLKASGEKKINVIKVVRALTNLGLKEAKDVVEATPSTVLAASARKRPPMPRASSKPKAPRSRSSNVCAIRRTNGAATSSIDACWLLRRFVFPARFSTIDKGHHD